MSVITLSPAPIPTQTEDYSKFLRLRNLKYKEVEQHYFQVGTIKNVQGWILHVSVIRSLLPQLLSILVPELAKEKVAFKIIQNAKGAELILGGSLGNAKVGKIISIYPGDDEKALSIAKKLIDLTSSFRGPEIVTDRHLGGTVYTRYGSYNPIQSGQFINDQYHIPFQMPNGIKWPFASLTSLQSSGTNITLQNKYLIRSEIRAKAKGRVLKTLRVKGILISRCIIKESKHDMCDEIGRDLKDRLHWQQTLYHALNKEIPLPKIYELFQENGNTYLAMEFVQGPSLQDAISVVYKDNYWVELEVSKKLVLLDYLLQVIAIIENLHNKGYVHRDITPENFIVDKQKRVVMIDLELAYDLNQNTPNPPYRLGTLGYMSPEQLNTETPTTKEDIYGLGALMIVFFTNLSPTKFNVANSHQVSDCLEFFIRHETVSDIIIRCLRSDAAKRPSLHEIKATIQIVSYSLMTDGEEDLSRFSNNFDRNRIEETINKTTLALNSSTFAVHGKSWHSNAVESEMLLGGKQLEYCYYPWLHTGIGGIMYVLGKAKKANISVDKIKGAYARNWKYLQQTFIRSLPQIPTGLYFGAAGVAVSLTTGMDSGLISPSLEIKSVVKRSLQISSEGLDLADGLAGQGIAIIYCLPYLDREFAEGMLKQHVNTLLDSQQRDGSWICNGEKKLGFSYGIAGIIIFLLGSLKVCDNVLVRIASAKGLDYLCKQARRSSGKVFWRISNKNKSAEIGLSGGFNGIALCLIRGYEVFKTSMYRKLAEDALHNYPVHALSSNFSLADGISGLGEVYLEAYRVFKVEEWLLRATWIANVISHSTYTQSDGSSYWKMNTNNFTTADLMAGNSGPLHFLTRYIMPDKLGFPIIE